MVRSIKVLVHREAEGGWFWVAVLDCGHPKRLDWLREMTAPCPEPLGGVVICERCDRLENALARLLSLHRAGMLAQVDAEGAGDGRLKVYAKDPTSPKGRSLLFLIEDCERVRAVLRELNVCVFLR
jgi:hypothetical protein